MCTLLYMFWTRIEHNTLNFCLLLLFIYNYVFVVIYHRQKIFIYIYFLYLLQIGLQRLSIIGRMIYLICTGPLLCSPTHCFPLTASRPAYVTSSNHWVLTVRYLRSQTFSVSVCNSPYIFFVVSSLICMVCISFFRLPN